MSISVQTVTLEAIYIVQAEVYCHVCGACDESEIDVSPTDTMASVNARYREELVARGWGEFADDEGDTHAVCDDCIDHEEGE